MLRITKDGFLWLIVSKSEAKGIFFDKKPRSLQALR